MLAQLVRLAAGIHEADEATLKQQRLVAAVARHVPLDAQRRVAEFLGELVDAGFDDSDSEPLRAARRDPLILADQLRRAWVDFVRAEAEHHTLVLVLEDLHWGDRSSVSFIDSMLQSLTSCPVMALALARPEIHEVFRTCGPSVIWRS